VKAGVTTLTEMVRVLGDEAISAPLPTSEEESGGETESQLTFLGETAPVVEASVANEPLAEASSAKPPVAEPPVAEAPVAKALLAEAPVRLNPGALEQTIHHTPFKIARYSTFLTAYGLTCPTRPYSLPPL